MRVVFLAIAFTVFSTVSGYTKGTRSIEVTPESIEQMGLPWEIRIQNQSGGKNPDYTWFISIYIKFRDGEKYSGEMPHVPDRRPLGQLEMRDEHGNLLMNALLSPNSVSDKSIEFQFSVHKRQLGSFYSWYIPRLLTAADPPGFEEPPRYYIHLDKLIDENTLPEYHLEWPRKRPIAPPKASELPDTRH